MRRIQSSKDIFLINRILALVFVIFLVSNGLIMLFILSDDAKGDVIETIFFDDMEPGGPAANGEWSIIDNNQLQPPQSSQSPWEYGVPAPTPSPYSPSNVWGTELSGPYQSPTENILVTPEIDLSKINPEAIISVKLTMWQYYNFADFDGGFVEVNPIPYSLEPQILEPEGGYPGLFISYPITKRFSGYTETSSGWVRATFDITDYIGQTIDIGFHFSGYYTDGSSARGWYIDDVLIEVTRLETPVIFPNQNDVGLAGDTLIYTLTVTNYNTFSDHIDIFFTDELGWDVDILNATTLLPLADHGGDPSYGDVFLQPNGSINILVMVTIPLDVTEWDISDLTTIYAQSGSNASKWNSCELVSKTPSPDVGIVDVDMPLFTKVGTPFNITITLENLGDWTATFDVLGEISSMLLNPLTLSPSSAQTVLNLIPGHTIEIQWWFTPTIRGDYSFSATTLFDMDQVSWNNRTSSIIKVVDFLWTDDMEEGGDAQSGNWTNFKDSSASTVWELGFPIWPRGPSSLPTPSSCWGTDLDYAYEENTDCYLFTPQTRAFDFTDYHEISLEFEHWMRLQAEPSGDEATVVYTYEADPISGPGIQGPQATYTNRSYGWKHVKNDFSFLSGQPYVRFGWRLFEDIGANNFEPGHWPGWYLDDVVVWANHPMPQMIITEIDDSSGDEHIEVYNSGVLPILLSDFQFTLDHGSTWLTSGSWSTPNLAPGATAYYIIPAGIDDLDDQGGSILLVNTSSPQGVILDQVSYGQKGTAPDPIPGESTARYWSGSEYMDEWSRETVPTIGSINDNPGEVDTKYIVLNEVSYNPINEEDGFMELMYVGSPVDPDVDVLNWILMVGDSVFSIPAGPFSTVLNAANPFYVINATMVPGLFGAIDTNGDNVYLFTNSGDLVDEVGWDLPHSPDTSVSRVPHGFGVPLNGVKFGTMGYDDQSSIAAGWVFERMPTMAYIFAGLDQEKRNFPGEYVRFNLTLHNRQSSGDLVEIFNTSSNGWSIEIFDATDTAKLSDFDGDGICDIWLAGSSSINITVRVHIPEDFPIPDTDSVQIYIQSDTDPLVGDLTYLDVILYPYLEPSKSIDPSSIFLKGSGYQEEAIITLGVKGSGVGIPGRASNMADIVFVVDDTGSMEDDIEYVKQDIDYITDRILINITSVRFGLITYKDQPELDYDVPLTYDVEDFKDGVIALNASGGGDYEEAVKDALIMGRDESDWRDAPAVRIMILMGDADPHDVEGAINVSEDAHMNYDIFTCAMDANLIGLQSFEDIAQAGHGIYEHVGNSEEMADSIINAILYFVPAIDLAGVDIDQGDSDYMIQDVLPEYIDYVPGSFTIEPDYIYVDSENRTILQWNVTHIRVGQKWSASFRITSSVLGLVDSNDYLTSRINYTRWDNSSKTSLFPKTQVLVKLGEPEPPELLIDVVDGTGGLDGRGKNTRLFWIPTEPKFIQYYLIYRSEDQNEFDFSDPWMRTDVNWDNGISPLRNSWNDTGSSDPLDANYNDQWYYAIRAVDVEGKVSSTSRTVGKWTRTFEPGTSTFSIPLEPLYQLTTDDYTTDMNAEHIRYMNYSTRTWRRHVFGGGGINNTQLIVGEGYEVGFSTSTTYTFCGLPGSMISYDHDNGFLGFDHSNEARNLTVDVGPSGGVILSWQEPSSMGPSGHYEVYYSTTRDGFFGTMGNDYYLVCPPLNFGTTSVSHKGINADDPGKRLYYMVVPYNETGVRGASTYSIGVWTEEYSEQYDTMGIPLKMGTYRSADWFCDNIPGSVGINYHIDSEGRWGWHSARMPQGAYDPELVMTEGYQISTASATQYTFIGR